MVKAPWNTRSETETNIIMSYLELSAADGKREPSVSQVIARANCARATFYRHYAPIADVREDILAVFTPTKVTEALLKDLRNVTFDSLCHEYAVFYTQCSAPLALLAKTPLVDEFERRQRDLAFMPIFDRYLKSTMQFTNKQFDYLTCYIANSKAYMIRLWAERGCEVDLEQLNLIYMCVVEENLGVHFARSTDSEFYRRVDQHRNWFEYPWRI